MININHYIEQLGNRTNVRFDCPSCGGENSLSLSRVGMQVKYHCFRASCDLKGMNKVALSTDAIRRLLEARTAVKQTFELPPYLTKGISSEKCLRMLLNTHTDSVYKEGLFNIAYDPKLDRFCYLVKHKGEIVGAVGRALGPNKKKTYNYPGSANIPFIVHKSDTLVCVEDCASAASIARENFSGCALLGTTMKAEYVQYILKYPKIIIALDKDARKKCVQIKNSLTYYHKDVSMWHLNKDIKDMSDTELREFVCVGVG